MSKLTVSAIVGTDWCTDYEEKAHALKAAIHFHEGNALKSVSCTRVIVNQYDFSTNYRQMLDCTRFRQNGDLAPELCVTHLVSQDILPYDINVFSITLNIPY